MELNIQIHQIILLTAFCWFVTHLQPLQNIISHLVSNRTGLFANVLSSLLSCSQCFGLWFSVSYLYFIQRNFTFELFCTACIISISTLVLSLTINKLTY